MEMFITLRIYLDFQFYIYSIYCTEWRFPLFWDFHSCTLYHVTPVSRNKLSHWIGIDLWPIAKSPAVFTSSYVLPFSYPQRLHSNTVSVLVCELIVPVLFTSSSSYIFTYSDSSYIFTYSDSSYIFTYSNSSYIFTYSNSSYIVTYSNSSYIFTYSIFRPPGGVRNTSKSANLDIVPSRYTLYSSNKYYYLNMYILYTGYLQIQL